MPSKTSKSEPDNAPEGFKYNPLKHVRWLYTTFLQNVFAYAPPGCLHWNLDEQVTEIVITAEYPLDAEVLGHRPGITLTRAPVSFFQLGFDDMLQYDYRTGKKTKSVLVPGTMVINCCSSNDLESEHIAWVVAEHLWLLRDVLMRQGFYDVGRGIQVGAPSTAGSVIQNDQGREWYSTQVMSPYHFYRTSSLTPLNRQMVSQMNLRMGATPTAVPQPNGPAMLTPNLPFEECAHQPPSALQVHDGQDLPKLPHPLNPAQTVRVRVIRATSNGLAQALARGRAVPIHRPCVQESSTVAGLTVAVRI